MRLLLTAMLLCAGLSQAATLSLVGDKDCFGIPGVTSCPDGSLFTDGLGGSFFSSYRTGSDPLYTDEWGGFGSVSFAHVYALPPVSSTAVLEMRIAGIHDVNPDISYQVLVNGTLVGLIPFDVSSNAFQQVRTYLFSLPSALLTGTDTVSLSGTGNDGFSIDYSQLSADPVPEPGTFGIAALALILATQGLRRRRSTY